MNVANNKLTFQSNTTHDWWKPFTLNRVDAETGRYYVTPEGNHYPSVTTVLGKGKEHFIEEWRNAVGHESADKTTLRAGTRGTQLHNNVEKYLKNEPVTIDKTRFLDISLLRGIVPLLNRISNVKLLESQLYSDVLKLAGTVDCVADFDEEPTIIDFKTTTKMKEKYEIEDYFIQVSIYSYMVSERYGVHIPKLAILIANEFGPAQLYCENRTNFRGHIKELINN